MNTLSRISRSHLLFIASDLRPVICVAGLKVMYLPKDFKDVEFPERNKLQFMPKIPQNLVVGSKPRKSMKRLIDMRGPELIHNEFIHKQYGIIALCGGQLKHGHFEMIRNTVNRHLDTKTMFAVWRVDAPWKPITKKGQGKRMGGGKGAIDHYTTPIKAGRVIIEIGGTVEYPLVHGMLRQIALKLPFRAMATSHEAFEKLKQEEEEVLKKNLNPYTFEYCIRNNMGGCHSWIGRHDLHWFGKYR